MESYCTNSEDHYGVCCGSCGGCRRCCKGDCTESPPQGLSRYGMRRLLNIGDAHVVTVGTCVYLHYGSRSSVRELLRPLAEIRDIAGGGGGSGISAQERKAICGYEACGYYAENAVQIVEKINTERERLRAACSG